MNVFKTAAVMAAVLLSVHAASGEIKPMASREYVDRKVGPKRDKDDLKIYRKRKDIWTFTNWAASGEDHPAPDEFLAAANAANFGPLRYLGGWMGATVYWPNGNIRFAQPAGTYPPGGADALEINFILAAYDATGTNQLYTFGATATRVSATDETLVEHDWARLMTDDAVWHLIADATNGNVDGTARPLPKYLHALDFSDSYPEAAEDYYRSRGNGKTEGGCSSVRSGGYLCRNFDYPFDYRAEFVVKMSAGNGRFASVGVAQVGTNLTEQIVTSGKWSKWYKALPGATVDGINEHGVVAEINVVDTPVTGWHTTGNLHPLAAVRWVLDNATNAQSAATYIAANIRFPQGWTQNFHYMIADAEKTYIVENGTATDGDEYHEPDEPVTMTNFQLSKFPWDGMGMERFGLLLGGANITNAWYTRAYRPDTTPPWVSEFYGDYDALALATNYWARAPKEAHRGESFNGVTWWQTVHTSVYDITNCVLRVAVQETDDWYKFALAKNGTDEAKVREIASEVVAPVASQVSSLQSSKANAASVTAATRCKITYNQQGIVTAGANLTDSDIPSIAASKITSGTFNTARIPSLPASKINSGTFPDARIASASVWNSKPTKNDLKDATNAVARAAKGFADNIAVVGNGFMLGTPYTAAGTEGNSFRSVGFGDGVWIAGDIAGNLLRSETGTNGWEICKTADPARSYARAIRYRDGLWTAAFRGGQVLYSMDGGTSWIQVDIGREIYDICYDPFSNDWFAAVNGGVVRCEFGDDQTFIATVTPRQVAASDEGIVVIGSAEAGSGLWYARPGETVFRHSNVTVGNFRCLTYMNGQFIAGQYGTEGGGGIWRSVDGITWEKVDSRASTYYCCTWASGQWVMTSGYFGRIAYSANGIDWTWCDLPDSVNVVIHSCANGNGLTLFCRNADDGSTGGISVARIGRYVRSNWFYSKEEVDAMIQSAYVPSERDPAFSNAVLKVQVASLSTNITEEVYIAATNACANLGIDPALIPGAGTTGTVGGLIVMLFAVVFWMSKKIAELESKIESLKARLNITD